MPETPDLGAARQKVAVLANTTWYLHNFRLNLLRALQATGFEVVAIGPADAYVDKLVAAGIQHRPIPLVGDSVNPLRELITVWALLRLLRRERVDVVLSYTPKGNIYSALAASVLGIPSIPNVSGLGRAFVRQGLLTWLVRKLYRYTFGRAPRVFFQNREDLEMFVREGLVRPDRAERLPGSGVDVEHFKPPSDPPDREQERVVFLLLGRMLWDKGVGDFVEAGRIVKSSHPKAEFRLLGFVDVGNPAAISRGQIAQWEAEGVVRYLGSSDDVVPLMCAADCVVLPSYYREGVPRSLLEAASLAIPVITTDTPGCRDVVENGSTGLLCRPQDPADLADKMRQFLDMHPTQRREMGRRAREKILREFDERIVIDRYLDVISQLEAV